jgi:hypothetical protein
MRFDDRKDFISVECYGSIEGLSQSEKLIKYDKPFSKRMLYDHFKNSGYNLKGDGWILQRKEVKRSENRINV